MLEEAISGNVQTEPLRIDGADTIPNGETETGESNKLLSEDIGMLEDGMLEDEPTTETPRETPVNTASPDSDSEKLENDLLKGIDDDLDELESDLANAALALDDESTKESAKTELDKPVEGDKPEEDKPIAEVDEKPDDKTKENPFPDNAKSEEQGLEEKFLKDDLSDGFDNIINENKEDSAVVKDAAVYYSCIGDAEIFVAPAESPKPAITELTAVEDSVSSTKNADDETKAEDLLVACESPTQTEVATEQENTSETSSSAGDTPEESSDEKQQTTGNGITDADKSVADSVKIAKVEQLEDMEVDDDEKDEDTAVTRDDEDLHLCIVEDGETRESSAEPAVKEQVPFKIKFMRKFSSAVGVLTRSELEELLIQKITESLMFCSENTELRARLEKQEKNCESFKKQLENLTKQYNDLDMIHTRVTRDLQDRPESAITPVKITRAVGLQVFSPVPRNKPNPVQVNFQTNHHQTTIKPTNKRPATELEQVMNGRSNISPENVKRKKTTPLRPALSEKERQMLANQEAKVEQKIRNTAVSSVKLPANLVISPISNGQGPSSSATHANTNSSIDLTDDEESCSNGSFHQPPALVAIRGQNSNSNQSMRKTILLKSNIRPTLSKKKSALNLT